MDAYQWYSPSDQPVPAYYPSPTSSSDPSPTPAPHQPLHEQYLAPSFDQIQSNVGPERVLRKSRTLSEHSADRFSDAVYLHATPPYRSASPSSMASPYSPYDYSQRPRSRSIGTPDIPDTLRIPSPAPSIDLSSGETLSIPLASTSYRNHVDGDPSRSMSKPKHTKNRLRDVDRKNICLFHLQNKHKRQEDIGMHFGVERSTISKVLKEKEKWLKISPREEANDQTTKHRPTKFPEIEEVLLESLQHWSDRKINITDQLIRQKGLEVARAYRITTDRFKGSSGWVENFKHRHDIKRGEWLNARKLAEPTIPMTQLHPRVIPDTPVIKPYDRHPSPPPMGPDVPFDISLWPAPEPRKRRGLPAPPVVWPPAQRAAEARAAAEAQARAAAEAAQQQQQPALVLDPALQNVPAVTSPLETAHTQTQHGAYENGIGMMFASGSGSGSGSGANNNNNNNNASTPANPASNPTCQDAENALKVLISFLESDGRDIVKDSDRDALHQIRGAMNQWSNRIYATA